MSLTASITVGNGSWHNLSIAVHAGVASWSLAGATTGSGSTAVGGSGVATVDAVAWVGGVAGATGWSGAVTVRW